MKEIKTITIQVDKEFHKKLKLLSVQEDMSIKDMFIEDITKRLKKAKIK